MNKLGFAGWILAAILLAVLAIQRSCTKKIGQNLSKTIEKLDTFYKDTGSTKYLPVMIPGKKEVVAGQTIYLKPTHEDTIAILKNCFALRIYKDTLKSKSGKVQGILTDSIEQNKRKSLTLKGTLKDSTISTERFKLFIGIKAGLGLDLKTAVLVPEITIVTKKDASYSIGFDVINRMPIAGMSWKVHF